MAVRIKLDQITEAQKKLIREKLYLQPKRTNFAVNKFTAVEKDPVLFYWIDKPNNEIVLPYTFANALFQKHLNSTIQFPPGSFKFTGKLRAEQVPVVEEALKQLNSSGTTTLALPTGFGKSITATYLGAIIMSNGTGGLMLILTNRETIQKGWVETVTGNTDAAVWVVDSKMKIPSHCNVIITMDGKFQKIPWEIRKLVSVFVIDEAHCLSTSSQVPVLLGVCPKYVIACSATLSRPDGMHVMVENIVGQHKVEIKNNKKFTVYKLHTGIKTELVKNKQGTTNFSALVKELAFNPKRNAMIIDFIEQNKHLKVMVLTWSVEHVNLLYKIMRERGESVDMLAGTKSSYIDSRVLVGSISKISVGFDAKNVSINFDGINIDTLLLCGSTKSYNLHIQSIGRAFRSDNPLIVEFIDDDRISKSHSRERDKNYENLNCEIKVFKVNNDVVLDKEVTQNDINSMHAQRLKAHGPTPEQKVLNLEGDKQTTEMHSQRLKAFLEKTKA